VTGALASQLERTVGASLDSSLESSLERGELAELLRAFNDVTLKLQSTQETLRGEVVRLQGELEQANAQLRRSRELAALGEMAAGIAHEIRNPLGSIRLYAEALRDDLAEAPEPRRMAEKIGSAVTGLDRVVGDVLAFAREVRLRQEPCEPAALLERAVQEARCELLDAGASAEIDSTEDLVVCDPDLVRRALVNLVRNAAEAAGESGAGGVVRLTAEPGRRRGADGRRVPCMVLAVEDSGPGIPAEALGRMFNPFFTTRAAGTGLGLAIVHRIVDAHGGAVEVSRCGAGRDEHALRGARVAILLPADPEQALEPTPRAGGEDMGGNDQHSENPR
jgi:signal transduction histidine kinase